MKFLKYLLFLLLIVIIGLLVYIAVQPSDYNVTRSRTINAPAPVIYNNVIDLKNWEAWSPWVEKDPTTIITLSEKTNGVGGSYSWTDKHGSGTMKTIGTVANESIKYNMQFEEFPPSEINWNFKQNEDGTTDVSWNMVGKDLPFGFKAYTAFMGTMEEQAAPDFERGLELLDSIVVNSMKAYNVKIDGITEYGGGFYLYKTTSANSSNISAVMGQQFGEIMSYAIKNNITPNGMPFTIYEDMNPESGGVIMSQAIPVPSKVTVVDNNNILSGFIPKIKVLKATLKGNYIYLPEAWTATMKYVTDNTLEQTDIKPFEIYTTDPGNYPNPADWITEIYIPVK